MIGGWITDISDDGDGIHTFTCAGRRGCEAKDMIKVRVKDAPRLPAIGTECWWQSGKVYCEGDTLVLQKHGYSFGHGPRIAAV
jgi:hypothetical protein